MSLFTPDTHFVVYMNARDPTPSQELHSRAALAPVFDDLNKYAATMHFVAQSTILTLTGDRATGEAYTLAHHLTIEGEKQSLMLRRSPLLGYVRQDRQCVAVCEAPTLRRLAGGTRSVMTATNKLVSGTSMHVLNVGQKCPIIVGGCALLRFSN